MPKFIILLVLALCLEACATHMSPIHNAPDKSAMSEDISEEPESDEVVGDTVRESFKTLFVTARKAAGRAQGLAESDLPEMVLCTTELDSERKIEITTCSQPF